MKIECYKRDLERYNNRFIQPLRQPRKVSPAIFYYNDHQQQLRQEVSGQKAGIAKMINHFKALPQAMQTAYEKKSADALSRKQKQFEEQKEKFMIPQVKTHYPGLIYN